MAVACSAAFAETTSAQEAPDPLEYRVKAAYILNFARYVEWPASAFTGADAPIHVCVIGGDPFGNLLDQALDGRRVHGRPFRVLRLPRPTGELCHVAFLGRATGAMSEAWRLALAGEPILTVGETPDFARDGGMIGFVLADETVRFEINVGALEAAGLEISSRVLTLATRLYAGDAGS